MDPMIRSAAGVLLSSLNKNTISGEASTVNPTKQGMAITMVKRRVWEIFAWICFRSLLVTAAVRLGMTYAASPFAMARGTLMRVLYFPVKIPCIAIYSFSV